MSLRVLIVDDHAEFRALLRYHIASRWPAAEVREYDPVAAGPMPEEFTGAGIDLVLLDYQFGDHGDGLEYLRRFRSMSRFPPVIMLTAAGNEDLAVQAIKAGAADYIPKSVMTHERLTSAIQSALDSRHPQTLIAAAPAAASGVPPGVAIDGYEMLSLLAEGGAGSVYFARKLATQEYVAIKVMAQRTPNLEQSVDAQRLHREYELIRKVNSPRIVKLHELGIDNGHVYLVMEYFAHGSLRQHLRAALPRAQALDYLRQIAMALEIIHRAGIVHRDLKPANVMLRADGSLVLIDFGTAKFGHDMTLTSTGSVMGTPHYMSPEQCAGEKLTPASDLYSLGIMFYEMLTGELPYTAATPLAVLYKHQYAPLPALPEPLADLQPLLDRLLAKSVEQRCERARTLLQQLALI